MSVAEHTSSDRRPQALISWGLAGATAVASLVFVVLAPTVQDKTSAIVPAVFLVMGLLITIRQPGNLEGRLLEVVALAWALSFVAPFDGSWVVPLGIMATHLLLRFPDGALPSQRWRPVSWLSTAAIVVLPFVVTTASSTSASEPGQPNPYHLSWVSPFAWLLVLLPVAMLLSAASLFARYRRADDVQRHQIRWLAYAAAVVVIWYVVVLTVSLVYDATQGIDSTQSSWFGTGYPWWVLAMEASVLLSFLLIPVGFAVGILKYRLFDIDRIISRTVSYALVTGLLVLLFAAIVVTASRPFSGRPNLVVAAATLVAAGLARPLLNRVRAGVDRRFNRSRYDAQRAVERFGEQLRGQVDVDQVSVLLLDTVVTALAPATVRLALGRAS